MKFGITKGSASRVDCDGYRDDLCKEYMYVSLNGTLYELHT